MEENNRFNLGKTNYLLMIVGVVVIFIGFLLMTGSTTVVQFDPDVFSTRRITVGPMVALAGFVFIIFAILYKSKSKSK